MLIENFLRSKEYWYVVEDRIQELKAGTSLTNVQKMEIDAQKLKDLKAKNYLFQAIDSSILETILCKDKAKHIWDSMKRKYQGNVRAKRVRSKHCRHYRLTKILGIVTTNGREEVPMRGEMFGIIAYLIGSQKP
ncbi:hypothetical protein PVK06_012753 [Gossypium arboreum]|uniref:Retrovirus-related Pol polyprotein from transposon TNT 1-94 n=1 Tax=Gossypium arboreum TaxID=29729 RepID=A0ABR0QDD0_GOSAR|nr:hypothetical protein PVK06_012753 [Gossypium arboreum]